MATLKQKIAVERKMRELIETEHLPEPDWVEYGYTCVRLVWERPRLCVVIDIDEAPEGFEKAMGRLGFLMRLRPPLSPADCLVIEDTVAGVEAGRRAGMRVLALCHSASANDLRDAEIIRNSLAETDLDAVLRELAR